MADIELGRVIRGYEFLSVIGVGGFATVYLVKDVELGFYFAAKVAIVNGSNSDEIWELFDSEVQALLRLDHPNIIRLYKHFREEDKIFIILEYCSNGSIWDHMRQMGPLKGSMLYTVIRELFSAIRYAWGMGVYHHDIKPHNVLITDEWHVKLADFGIALRQNTSGELSEEMLTDDFRCSFAFAAPEIVQWIPYDPAQSDIWSLGVTILSLVIGDSPWGDTGDTELFRQICGAKFKLPLEVDRNILGLTRNMIQLKSENRCIPDEQEVEMVLKRLEKPKAAIPLWHRPVSKSMGLFKSILPARVRPTVSKGSGIGYSNTFFIGRVE